MYAAGKHKSNKVIHNYNKLYTVVIFIIQSPRDTNGEAKKEELEIQMVIINPQHVRGLQYSFVCVRACMRVCIPMCVCVCGIRENHNSFTDLVHRN